MKKLLMMGLLATLAAATVLAQAGARAKPGGGSGLVYDVSVELGNELPSFSAPTYTPSCLATTPEGGYTARFPRHDPCAVVRRASNR